MIIVKTLIIKMTFKVIMFALKRKKALYRFNVGEVLICRGDNTSFSSSLNGSFNIFEQQNQASLFYKADRKRKACATSQVVFNFIEKSYLGIVG